MKLFLDRKGLYSGRSLGGLKSEKLIDIRTIPDEFLVDLQVILKQDVTFEGSAAFGGPVTFDAGVTFDGGLSLDVLSGSLTRLSDGTSYLIAGSNVTITSQSNGSVVIASSGGGSSGGGDPNATYLVLSTTASLSAERVFTAGTGLVDVDGGAGSAYTIAVNGSVARVSGSHFGNVSSAGTGSFVQGISGSLTRLVNGTSFIEAGSNILVTSTSNGSIVITSTATGGGDNGASYIVVGLTSSLSNERVFATASGLFASDAGADAAYTVAVDGTVARISGSHFTGNVSSAGTGSFALGLSGSLTRLVNGTSYLAASGNINIASTSNGQVTVSTNDSFIVIMAQLFG